jgi:hypothetical protein
MEGIKDYCPMVGKCPYEPVGVKPNSYFLVQPFDSEKEEREKAIGDALKKFYDGKKYELKKSDFKISDNSSYCDICLKIKASQFCIVDISGELHEIIDKESGKKESKVSLRPNVALELGMAYGFNKPALILSRKLNGKRLIPSDIAFVRYIDISLIKFGGWSVASQKLLNRLRESVPFRLIKESLDLDNRKLKENFKKYYESLLHLKERLPSLRNRNFRINQIVYRGGRPVGIIRDAEDLIEGICFDFYVLEQEIEQLVGQLKVYHVQPNGLAQVEFHRVEGGGDFLDNVTQHCFENDTSALGEHRLELVDPEEVKKIKLKEIKEIIDMLS